jgi:hypothetical protein
MNKYISPFLSLSVAIFATASSQVLPLSHPAHAATVRVHKLVSAEKKLSKFSTNVRYDVVCFAEPGFSIGSIRCDATSIYKVPRGTKITTFFKRTTGLQHDNDSAVSFTTSTIKQQISTAEMESLVSRGADIYAMYYQIPSILQKYPTQSIVDIFDVKSGKFKKFAKARNQLTFTTGSSNFRVVN